MKKRGLYIAFDGPDFGGKTSMITKVQEYLASVGFEGIVTSEPGGTRVGLKIREVLRDKHSKGVIPLAELFLFLADRAQHLHDVVIPALDDRLIVIQDRGYLSSFCYQSLRGVPIQTIKELNEAACFGVYPDLVILLDVDVQTGMDRLKLRDEAAHDRYDLADIEFKEKLRQRYLDFSEEDPSRIKVVDASRSPDEVYASTIKIIEGRVFAAITGLKAQAGI